MCRLHSLSQRPLVREFCGVCCLGVCDLFFFFFFFKQLESKRWNHVDTRKTLIYWSPTHCSPRQCNSFLNKWLKGGNRWPRREDKQNINICVHRNTDRFICLNTHIEKWFSDSQILWPHDTGYPQPQNYFRYCFINCNFATVTNHSVNVCAFQWS